MPRGYQVSPKWQCVLDSPTPYMCAHHKTPPQVSVHITQHKVPTHIILLVLRTMRPRHRTKVQLNHIQVCTCADYGYCYMYLLWEGISIPMPDPGVPVGGLR